MRRLRSALTVLALLVTACAQGEDSTAPASTATVYWKLDGASCTAPGPVSIQFFVDGSNVGTETLSTASPQSRGYTTGAGQHVFGARVANTGLAWANITDTVPAGGSYTVILACG